MRLSHSAVFIVCLAAAPASAQPAIESAVKVASGETVRLGYYGTAGKGCAPLPAPSIDVVSQPAHGVMTARVGALATKSIASCPNLKIPVQIVYYRAQSGYVGADKIVFAVKERNGRTTVWSYSIDIEKGASSPTSL